MKGQYVLYGEVIVRDYYLDYKEDAYKLIEKLKKKYSEYEPSKVIVLYLGTNYDNKILRNYRLTLEIRCGGRNNG